MLLTMKVAAREAVDELVHRAADAGGKADVGWDHAPSQSMHGRSFEDLDGHVWEIVWVASG